MDTWLSSPRQSKQSRIGKDWLKTIIHNLNGTVLLVPARFGYLINYELQKVRRNQTIGFKNTGDQEPFMKKYFTTSKLDEFASSKKT